METVVLPAQDHLAQERYRHQSSVMSAHVMAGLMYPHGGLPRSRRKVKSHQQVLVASSLHSDIAIACDKSSVADAARTGPFRQVENQKSAAFGSKQDLTLEEDLFLGGSGQPVWISSEEAGLPTPKHLFGVRQLILPPGVLPPDFSSQKQQRQIATSLSTATPVLSGIPAVQRQILRTKSDGALLQQGVRKSVEGEKQFSDRRKAHDRNSEGSKASVEKKVTEKNAEKFDRRKGPERRTMEKKVATGANGSLVDNSSNVLKKSGVITILQRPQTKEAAAENIALFTGRPIEDVTKQFLKSAQVVSQPHTKKSIVDVTAAVEAAKDSDLRAKEGGEAEHTHFTRGLRNVSPKRERVSRKKGSRDSLGKVAARLTEGVHTKARREGDGLGEVPRPRWPALAAPTMLLNWRDAEHNEQAKERESRIGEGSAQDRSANERQPRIGEGNEQDRSAKERESRTAEFESFLATPHGKGLESEVKVEWSTGVRERMSLSKFYSQLNDSSVRDERHLKSDGPVSLAHAKTEGPVSLAHKKLSKQSTTVVEAVKDAELHSKDGREGEHVHSRLSRNVSPKTEREVEETGSRLSSGEVAPSTTDVVPRGNAPGGHTLAVTDPTWELVKLSPKEMLPKERMAASADVTLLTMSGKPIFPDPETYYADESSPDSATLDPIGLELHHERAATAPGGLQRGSSDSMVREMEQALSDAGRGGGSGSFRDVVCTADGIEVFYIPSSPQKKCERWAGPAYTQSPPPSTLPFPTFPLQRVKLADVVWRGPQDTNSETLSSSAPSSPTHMANLFLSAAAMQQSPFVDPSSATKDLRRILNLDVEDGFEGGPEWTEGGVESATQSLKRMLQLG